MRRLCKYALASLVFGISLMITACGAEPTQTETTQESDNKEVAVNEDLSTDDMEDKVTAEESVSAQFPASDYEEWLVDDDGNKLWGYHAPLGFIKTEDRSGAIGVFYSRDGEYEEEISIFCSKDTDGKWEEWYKTGKADTDLYSDREGHVSVIENGTIETAYGEFKDFLLVDDRDDWGNSEEAIFWMPSGWCVHIEISTTGSNEYLGTMKHLLDILTGEKQEPIEVGEGYDNYLCTADGEKVFGFNNVGGTTAQDEPGMDGHQIFSMGDNSFSMNIFEYNLLTSVYEEGQEDVFMGVDGDGEDIFTHYQYQDELNTIYGTAKLYLDTTDGFDWSYETAIFRVNGRYICVRYTDLDGIAYRGNLKEIIETQLLGTE